VLVGIAYVERRRGNWEGSLASHRRALELDPWNPSFIWNMGSSLIYMRRYEEAETFLDQAISVAPGMRTPLFILATCLLHDGATERARRVLDQIPGPRDERWTMAVWDLEVFDGNHRAALELVESTEGERWKGVPTSLLACFSQRALGLDAAASKLRRGRPAPPAGPRGQPRNPFLLAMLAEAATLVGDDAGAARQLELAREIGLDDAVVAADLAVNLAWLEMLRGDLDAAVEQLQPVLQTPARISAAVLRGSAEWAPLRSSPRFQHLLASAQNLEARRSWSSSGRRQQRQACSPVKRRPRWRMIRRRRAGRARHGAAVAGAPPSAGSAG
jgi:tetratricopeptide (TPR) repeat protein